MIPPSPKLPPSQNTLFVLRDSSIDLPLKGKLPKWKRSNSDDPRLPLRSHRRYGINRQDNGENGGEADMVKGLGSEVP